MEKFTTLSGPAAPLLRVNVDTDAIIPSREMKKVSKQGLGEGLFANWRYLDVAARTENPEFVLNQAPYRHAPILISGANFGCGSSREHAVWALHEWGIRCVIAPSFGAIFRGNCIRNGILPVTLAEEAVRHLAQTKGAVTVDLEAQMVSADAGKSFSFEIDPSDKVMLLEGLDSIGVTLKFAGDIDRFETADRAQRPWLAH